MSNPWVNSHKDSQSEKHVSVSNQLTQSASVFKNDRVAKFIQECKEIFPLCQKLYKKLVAKVMEGNLHTIYFQIWKIC